MRSKATKAPPAPKVTLLLFVKERCAPCAQFKPRVEKLAKGTDTELSLMDATADESASAIMGFNIMAVPTLLILRNGKKYAEFMSDAKIEKIADKLAKAKEPDAPPKVKTPKA